MRARRLAVRAVPLAAAFLTAMLMISCRGKGETFARAPVVLISIDTLRSDHLPAYGYTAVATPAIDALRQDAILCRRAFSHYPMTLPSHTSIFTGQLPPLHGVRDNVGYPLDAAKHPYLPRLLKEAGYATGGAVSSYVLRGATGIAAGFDFYDDHLEPAAGESLNAVQRSGADTAKIALGWIDEHGKNGAPFFFFLHLYEPHAPYTPPEPFASRYANKYDGEIAAADAVVGDVVAELKRLGVYDRAIVVLLSDHGEGLGDHGEQQHGIFLYREALQVPLLVKLPGGRHAGATVDGPAELADVFPTVAGLLGLALPKGLAGTSILDLLGSKDRAQTERTVYSETFYPRIHLGWSELASLMGPRFHYIHGPAPELYDVAADPAERANVLARERRVAAELRHDLDAFDRQLAPPAEVDAETAAKLAALGYMGGASAAKGPLPDPKSQAHVLGDIETAFRLFGEEKDAEAIPIFHRLVTANPNMVDLWAFYALSLRRVGRKDEAAAAIEKAVQLSGGSAQLSLDAGFLLLETGHLDEAKAHAELGVQHDPAMGYDLLAQIAMARHDAAGALEMMKRALDAGAAGPSLRRQYALTLAEQGRTAEAIAALAQLPTSDPPNVNALAVILMGAGRFDEAGRALSALLAQHPDNARAHEMMGELALRTDRPQEAVEHLRRAVALNDQLANAWNTLGVALYQTAGPGPALDAWQRAVALDPTLYDALLNTGLVAAEAGRREEARVALRRLVATAPPSHAADIQKAQGLLRQLGG